MNALRPRAPFQALIVMDRSRLGRSVDEVPYALKRITDAGVRDEALRRATHARLNQARALYLRKARGQATGRPKNPTESKYLLTGLLRCGHCAGRMHVSK